jgi:hypothetical protein
LENCTSITEEKARKIPQVFFTRWLSFGDSVQALAGCIAAVISSLAAAAAERNTEGRAILHGVMDSMASVKFLLMTIFLADAIGVMKTLSLSMQKDVVHYSTLQVQIEAAVAAVQAMKHTPGQNLRCVLDALLDEPDGSGYIEYRSQGFKDSQKQRDDFRRAADHFIDHLVEHLLGKFPDTEMMEAYKVLSPQDYQQMSEEVRGKKFEMLLKHYTAYLNADAAREEWKTFNFIIGNSRYYGDDLEKFTQKYLHSANAYPTLKQLATIGLCIPMTSVSCERGISAYNAIKTDSRSQLHVEQVNNLLHIYVEGPRVQDFNFEASFSHWIEQKERRTFVTVAKASQP